MFVECERVFSSVKSLIFDCRNGLKEDVIEACTLLRHWIRAYNRDFDIWAGEMIGGSKLLQIVQFNSIQFHE
jgi:hypothetical protein